MLQQYVSVVEATSGGVGVSNVESILWIGAACLTVIHQSPY
jgi:hypothetical protein